MKLAAAVMTIAAQAIVAAATTADRTPEALAGTWIPDLSRYEEYWNPKDTNGLQRLPSDPSRAVPTLHIVVRREHVIVEARNGDDVVWTADYLTDERPQSVALDDDAVRKLDSHWTAGGLVTHWVTERRGAHELRGGELWALSADGDELTVTSVMEGLGAKRKTIAVYRRPQR